MQTSWYGSRFELNELFKAQTEQFKELANKSLSSGLLDRLQNMRQQHQERVRERHHEQDIQRRDDQLKEHQNRLRDDLRAMVPSRDINQLVQADKNSELLKDPAIRDKLKDYQLVSEDRSKNLERSSKPELKELASKQREVSKTIAGTVESHDKDRQIEMASSRADAQNQGRIEALTRHEGQVEMRMNRLEQAIETNRLDANIQNESRIKIERALLDKAIVNRDAAKDHVDGRPAKEVELNKNAKLDAIDQRLDREVPRFQRADIQLGNATKIEQYDAKIRSVAERQQEFPKIERQRNERIQHLDKLANNTQGDDKKAYQLQSKAESLRLDADRKVFADENKQAETSQRRAQYDGNSVFGQKDSNQSDSMHKEADKLDRDAAKLGDREQRLRIESGQKPAEMTKPDEMAKQIESPSLSRPAREPDLRERMDKIKQQDQTPAKQELPKQEQPKQEQSDRKQAEISQRRELAEKRQAERDTQRQPPKQEQSQSQSQSENQSQKQSQQQQQQQQEQAAAAEKRRKELEVKPPSM